MNWPIWREVEDILGIEGISPIVAVIPANEDPSLSIQPANHAFWDDVRKWQSRGWTIGLHGFRHHYDSVDGGIIGKNRYSEFAGHPEEVQAAKISQALSVFRREGVNPDLWVAPGHSFDRTTLRVLRREGVPVVSDGLFLYPGLDREGTFWIPQQLSDFESRPCGVWTVCLHPNWWVPGQVAEFRRNVQRYHTRLVGCKNVLELYAARRLDWKDAITERCLRTRRDAAASARRLWPGRHVAAVRDIS
jgi:predicted deacetylase